MVDISWDYSDRREYVHHIRAGMPPVIITAAVTGGHQVSDNPNVPLSAREQAEDAAAAYAAGARIVHIHAREPGDLTVTSNDPAHYREVNQLIRSAVPEMLIDNSQTVAEIPAGSDVLMGAIHYYKSAPIEAKPDIMALNPGPMTFRGGHGASSTVYATTFDETERTANLLRERGIKPQVFLYHPGHLDILEHLILHDALDKPYFVQLVFGQQSGIRTSFDSVLLMVRNLPAGCVFQTCALGLEEIHVNVLALLMGGHVRTGLEDSLLYQRDEPGESNAQFVERIVRIARDLGRGIATASETREMLGMCAAGE